MDTKPTQENLESASLCSGDLLAVPEGWRDNCNGRKCRCCAYSSSECGCDADWTPREIYELREKINRLMVCVTVEHESKEAFINRVRSILSANNQGQPSSP